MTEKNIFVYKLFFSLNISDFNLLLCENCTPPLKKVTPLFPSRRKRMAIFQKLITFSCECEYDTRILLLTEP